MLPLCPPCWETVEASFPSKEAHFLDFFVYTFFCLLLTHVASLKVMTSSAHEPG